MKKIIFLLIIIITLIFLWLVPSGLEPVIISWSSWQLEMGVLLILVIWLLSMIGVWMTVSILKIPHKVLGFWRQHRSGKSTNSFNQAIHIFLNEEYDEALQKLLEVNAKENFFETKLIAAACQVKLGKLQNLNNIMRQLKKSYPKDDLMLLSLHAKWLISMGEESKTYEMLATEVKRKPLSEENWDNLLQASLQTKKLEEWDEWLLIAKSQMSKKTFKELETSIVFSKLSLTSSAHELKQFWRQLQSYSKNDKQTYKLYIEKKDEFDMENNTYDEIKKIMKNDWDEQWLWKAVNFKGLVEYYDLIEWLRTYYSSNSSPIFTLSMAILSSRAKLWAISEDYLIKLDDYTEFNRIIILLRSWNDFNIENEIPSQQWLNLLSSEGLVWCNNPK